MARTLAEELSQITKDGLKNKEKAAEKRKAAAAKADEALRRRAREDAPAFYAKIVPLIKEEAAAGETRYLYYLAEDKYYMYLLEAVAEMLKADGLQAKALLLQSNRDRQNTWSEYGFIPNNTTVIDVTWE